MADDVPAFNSTRGAKAVHNTPVAAHRVPPARGTRNGAGPVPATLLAAAAVFIGASAHQSAMLAYFATLLVSIVPVMRVAWPEDVDGDLGRLDAFLRRSARLARAGLNAARADLAGDMRRLRDAARGNAVLAPVYDRAVERARVPFGALRRWAEATWSEHKGAAHAARFVLHLVGVVIYTAAAALVSAAYEAAMIRAPAALSHLRGVIKEMRCKKRAVVPSSGFKNRDVAWLIKRVIFLEISMDILEHAYDILGSSIPISFPCFMVLCATGVMVSAWAFLPHDSNDMRDTASNASRRVGGSRGEPTRAAELKELTDSWRFLWSLMVSAHFIDVYLLRLTLGPRPLAVAFMALCNVKIINVGKKVKRTPEDDGEGAQGAAEGGNDGGAIKWRRAAMAVLAASVVKVAAIGVLLNVHLAAFSLVSLCFTTVLLLIWEENLSDLLDASGEDKCAEEGAGFAGNVMGGADQDADEVKAERSKTSAKDEQEGSALEEQCDSSEEDVEQQRSEEPDYSSSSNSIDDPSGSRMDSWDFVEADPSAADLS